MTSTRTNHYPWSIDPVDVNGDEATTMLRLYFVDIVSRYYQRPATASEISQALADDPSHQLTPPSGALLLARVGNTAAGCVGLRLIASHIAELTRKFVLPDFRGQGGGSQLLRSAEQHARQQLAATTIRLDTRHDLTEARQLYANHGYHEVAPYNASPYADHWFEKHLN